MVGVTKQRQLITAADTKRTILIVRACKSPPAVSRWQAADTLTARRLTSDSPPSGGQFALRARLLIFFSFITRFYVFNMRELVLFYCQLLLGAPPAWVISGVQVKPLWKDRGAQKWKFRTPEYPQGISYQQRSEPIGCQY